MSRTGYSLSLLLFPLSLISLRAQPADSSDLLRVPTQSSESARLPADSLQERIDSSIVEMESRSRSRPHRLFAGVMAGSMTNRDEAGSPVTYSGIGFPFLLGYSYQGMENRHRLWFSYRKTGINAPTLTSELTTARGSEDGTRVEHTVDYSLRWFSYRYSRLVAEPMDGRLRVLGGVLWDNILFFRYYTYAERPLFDREQSIGSWEGILSLNASIEAEYDLDDGSVLSAELHAPFVAFLFRPRYSIQDDELIRVSFDNFSQLNNGRSRFVTQGDLIQLGAGLGYSRSLAEQVDIRLDYTFFYSRIDYPRPSATVENGLAVTVGYRL